jgi:hypothetical protein
MKDSRSMIDANKRKLPEAAMQPKRKEPNPNSRRIYINQRILRLREEMKGLQKELQDAQAASGEGAKDPKTNLTKIYARERMIVLRDELRSLTAEREALPKKPGAPARPGIA